MILSLETNNINEYLAASDVIDYHHENIQSVAQKLAVNAKNEVEIAKTVYEYVRDQIPHLNGFVLMLVEIK